MIILAQFFGILAVVSLLLSFQFKTRKNIILVNIVSRVFYICQYLLLGAFEGAILDFIGMISTYVSKHKEKLLLSKFFIIILVLINVLLVMTGLMLYENIFSLFAILGIVFEVDALWITKEKYIRIFSLLAAPFWLIFNVSALAYGSVVGNILTMISILAAIIRYDIKRG